MSTYEIINSALNSLDGPNPGNLYLFLSFFVIAVIGSCAIFEYSSIEAKVTIYVIWLIIFVSTLFWLQPDECEVYQATKLKIMVNDPTALTPELSDQLKVYFHASKCENAD